MCVAAILLKPIHHLPGQLPFPIEARISRVGLRLFSPGDVGNRGASAESTLIVGQGQGRFPGPAAQWSQRLDRGSTRTLVLPQTASEVVVGDWRLEINV
jgi:hypothetical protein